MEGKKKASAISSYEDNPEKMGDVLAKVATQGAVSEDDVKLYVEAAERKIDSTRVQNGFCNTICTICKRGYGGYAVKGGAVRVLISVFKRCVGDVDLGVLACQAFGGLLQDAYDEALGILKDTDGVSALVKMLSERIDAIELQKAGLAVVLRIVVDTEVQHAIFKSNGVEGLMHVLIFHQKDKDIALDSIRVFTALASNDKQRLCIVDDLGIDTAATIMRVHKDAQDVLAACCKAIGYMVVSLELAMVMPATLAASVAALASATSPITSPMPPPTPPTTADIPVAGTPTGNGGGGGDDSSSSDAKINTLSSHTSSRRLRRRREMQVQDGNSSSGGGSVFSYGPGSSSSSGGGGGDSGRADPSVMAALKSQMRAVKSGAVPLIVGAVEGNIDNVNIQKWGCFALGSIAYKNAAASAAVLDAGGVDAVLLVAAHANSPAALELALYALARLAMDDGCAQQVWDGCGVKTVLDRVKSFPRSPGVLCNAMLCLGYLAYNPQACSEIGMIGGIKPVVGAMRTCQGDADLQRAALFALGRLALNPANAEMIGFEQGIPTAISALRTFPDDNGVQQFGIDFLVNIAADNPQAVLAAGGVAAAEAAMKAFLTDPVLQASCCSLIENMAACCGPRDPQYFTADIILALGRTLKKHARDPSITEACARAFSNIALTGTTACEDLLEYGAALNVLYALEHGPVTHTVGLYLARFLANLIACTPRGAAKQRCLAAVPALLAIMAAFPGSAEATYECARALAALVSGTKVPPTAAAEVARGAKTIAAALAAYYTSDQAIARFCCVALAAAVAGVTAPTAATKAVEAPLVLRVMKLYQGDLKTQVAGCELLGTLAAVSESMKKDDDENGEGEGTEWIVDGGIQAVCAVAKMVPDTLSTQKIVMKTLTTFVSGEERKLKGSDVDAIRSFAKSLKKRFIDDKEVAEFVSAVL